MPSWGPLTLLCAGKASGVTLYIETALRPAPGEHHCVMVIAEFRGSTDKSAQKWAEVCCGPQRDSG